jgi:tetratricopeptide (TPR) repeat protein
MKTYKIYLLSVMLLAFISCNNYLDVKPKGKIILKTIQDFDQLLYHGYKDNPLYRTGDQLVLVLTADDWVSSRELFTGLGAKRRENIKPKLYRWDKDLFSINPEQISWNLSYKHIYVYNLVINNIKTAISLGNYTEKDRERIEAEAYIGRAYEYWLLVNTFAKQYSTTAANDPGVPIITSASVKNKTPKRASIKEVYDLIIKDISDHVRYLPEKSVSRYRFSKETAYACLARFYLQMGDYKKALKNASSAIDLKGEISSYVKGGDRVSEQYMKSSFYDVQLLNMVISDEMEALYDKNNDTRFKNGLESLSYLIIDNSMHMLKTPIYKPTAATLITHSFAPSVPEMYLIRAECNAREGNIIAAAVDINTLRKKRLLNYKAINFSNKKEALKFVLDERRRELLFMMGMRLFDLKRLNLETEFAKSVTHTLDGFDYTLKAGSNNLILPIPHEVISSNVDMKQNPRDLIIKTKAKKPNKATKAASGE